MPASYQTPTHHYAEAERLLAKAEDIQKTITNNIDPTDGQTLDEAHRMTYYALLGANAHATLATAQPIKTWKAGV